MSLTNNQASTLEMNLPIAGGDGSSPEKAIIILDPKCNPADVQQAVLENYYNSRGLPWKQLMQNLKRVRQRPMEVLKVAHLEKGDTHVRDWFFDLSRCLF